MSKSHPGDDGSAPLTATPKPHFIAVLPRGLGEIGLQIVHHGDRYLSESPFNSMSKLVVIAYKCKNQQTNTWFFQLVVEGLASGGLET
eukprot:7502526-Pyramimonas_sp.AAC.1